MEIDRFVDDAGDQLEKAIKRICPNAKTRIEIDNYRSRDNVAVSNLSKGEFLDLINHKDIDFFMRVYSEALGFRWEVHLYREEDLYENTDL